MKKIIKRIGVCFLASCMAFLVSCKTENPPSSGLSDIKLEDTNIILAENATTDYSVLVSKDASEAENYAVELLVEQFENATGAKLTVQLDNGQALNDKQKLLSVGRTSLLED